MTTTLKIPEIAPQGISPSLTLNCVNLVGRAGAEPEVKYFESGSVKATVSMAVKRPSRNTQTDWFTLEFWNKTAEVAANYLKKGDLFSVTGYLKIETWIDTYTGCERSRPVIKVNNLQFLGSKGRSNSDSELEDEAF